MVHIIKTLLILTVFLTSGCVTGTRNITLQVPAQASQKATVGNIQIVAINDNRAFEQKPKIPETPSSKSKLETLSAETKSMLVGRQRNGYGGAMGDVALVEGDSIQEQVRELVSAGLSNRGYSVSDIADKKLTIEIEKFWAWMVPGFISIGFESEIETQLKLDEGSASKTVTVLGKANNEGQIASNANWELSYKRAYEAFLLKLDQALEELGL